MWIPSLDMVWHVGPYNPSCILLEIPGVSVCAILKKIDHSHLILLDRVSAQPCSKYRIVKQGSPVVPMVCFLT